MKQYRTKKWHLLALVAACLVICAGTLVASQDGELDRPRGEPYETTIADQPDQRHQQQQQQQQHGHHSLIGLLLSPITATFQRARRMLSSRLGGVRDLVVSGFDEIETRTFKVFMRAYNKTYSPDELPKRMKLFFERRKLIEKSVSDFVSGSLTFVMRENAFIDWDESELKQLARASPPVSMNEMTAEEREAVEDEKRKKQDQKLELKSGDKTNAVEDYIEWSSGGGESRDEGEPAAGVSRSLGELSDDSNSTNLSVRAVERIPAQMDWRKTGCVAEPVNQLKCGACYAIATVGALESQRCINRLSSSPVLSPQQIVDCSRSYDNNGCDGGWPTKVLSYLQDTRVIASESCYPFVRRDGTCRLRQVLSSASAAKSNNCAVLASSTDSQLRYKVLSNERDILYHVAKTGPVIAVMRATDKFLYYSRGIFDDPTCTRKRDDVDHGIVIVGYGRENNIDYWIIKNSWGTTDWGEGGYGKFRRGINACSIGHWGWVITG